MRGEPTKKIAVAISLVLATMATVTGRHVEGKKPSHPASPLPSTLPYSSFLSPEVVQRLRQSTQQSEEEENGHETCGQNDSSKDPIQAKAIQLCEAKLFYQSQMYQNLRNQYGVSIVTEQLGGIATEIFTPLGGVAEQNKDRVLINLHAGAFMSGSRTASHIESIPISAVGRIKIVSVDYRMTPQFYFPAASEDVEKVYVQLLQKYQPRNIGIFGCSAGGLLTAQSVAWLQKRNLPMPGAVGMFCAGGSYYTEGDSGHFAAMWEKSPPPRTIRDDPAFEYFKKTELSNPLAYPVRSKEVMSRFPPSLLISSTRDFAMSSVVQTHSVLIQQGVPAELYVWEGLPHAFFYDPELPQSREMYQVTARFFERYLGKPLAEIN